MYQPYLYSFYNYINKRMVEYFSQLFVTSLLAEHSYIFQRKNMKSGLL